MDKEKTKDKEQDTSVEYYGETLPHIQWSSYHAMNELNVSPREMVKELLKNAKKIN